MTVLWKDELIQMSGNNSVVSCWTSVGRGVQVASRHNTVAQRQFYPSPSYPPQVDCIRSILFSVSLQVYDTRLKQGTDQRTVSKQPTCRTRLPFPYSAPRPCQALPSNHQPSAPASESATGAPQPEIAGPQRGTWPLQTLSGSPQQLLDAPGRL